jgi:hypothetical protein
MISLLEFYFMPSFIFILTPPGFIYILHYKWTLKYIQQIYNTVTMSQYNSLWKYCICRLSLVLGIVSIARKVLGARRSSTSCSHAFSLSM